MSRVDDLDLSETLSKKKSLRRVKRAQRHLTQLRLLTAGLLHHDVTGPGLVVVFEGMDSAGKGGAIRRLTAGLDPRQFRVVPVGPPTEEELRHHFLWRFQPTLPGVGEMTVYDRSWYGRLLVERVEELIDQETVERSAKEIVAFEDMLIHADVTVVKFWLQISDEEQLRRFNARAEDPMKHWKLTADDWRNREKREQYLTALNYMIETTDHPHAHWDLIAAEDKYYARAAVLETLLQRWRHDLKRRGLELPEEEDGDDDPAATPTEAERDHEHGLH